MTDLLLPTSHSPFLLTHDKVGKNDNIGSAEIIGLKRILPGVPTALKYTLSKQGSVEVVVTVWPGRGTGVGGYLWSNSAAVMG